MEAEGVGERGVVVGVGGFQGAFGGGESGGPVTSGAELLGGEGEIVAGEGKRWLQVEDALETRARGVELAVLKESPAEIVFEFAILRLENRGQLKMQKRVGELRLLK